MDISVIIPVHNDVRIKRCVESIDEDVEVIASMNCPTSEIEEIVREIGIKSCIIGEKSLSKAYNVGVQKSTKENVLFMDSDCVFKKGSLSRLYEKMGSYRIAKGKIIFNYNSYISSIISKGREFTTSESPQLFIPLLMVHKSIFDEVGDFNENMQFSSCCDFSDKVLAKRIPWVYVPAAQIVHDPLSIKADLRSAYRYGAGRSQKHRSRGVVRKPPYLEELKDYLIRGSKEKGIVTGLYLTLWYGTFTAGFLHQEFRSRK